MISYYLNAVNGNDANTGLNESEAFRTIARGLDIVHPGSQLLFRRGDKWDENIVLPRGGTFKNPIGFDSYHHGPLPVIGKNNISINTAGKSHIQFRNLGVKIKWVSDDWMHNIGVLIASESRFVSVENCEVFAGEDKKIWGICVLENDSIVRNNDISGISVGIKYLRTWNLGVGGLCELNRLHDFNLGDIRNNDGIQVGYGYVDWRGLLIQNNDISGHQEDGIDLKGHNIRVIGNHIHHPGAAGAFNIGIKILFGRSRPGSLLVAENHIHDIPNNGITSFEDGALILNNRIHSIGEYGITMPASCEAYLNKVYACKKSAISAYAPYGPSYPRIKNNLLDGDELDLFVRGRCYAEGGYNAFRNDDKVKTYKGASYSGGNDDVYALGESFIPLLT